METSLMYALEIFAVDTRDIGSATLGVEWHVWRRPLRARMRNQARFMVEG